MYRIILFAIAAGFEFLTNDGNNYLDWSLQVKAILMDQQLWEIVEEADEPPKAQNDEAAFNVWSHKNAIVLGVIQYSCRIYFSFVIEKTTSAKLAWDTLAVICALHKSKLHRYLYIQTFLT